MNPTQKELQLKLTVTADPSQGVRGLQQLAAEAKKTEAAVARVGGGAGMPGAVGGSGAPGPPASFGPFAGAAPAAPPPIIASPTGARAALAARASGGGMAALGGGIGSMAMRFAGPAAILGMGLPAIQSIGRSVNDKFLTNEQAERRFFRDVVPFGGTIQNFVDDVSGRNADYERAEVRARQRMAEVSGRLDLTQMGVSLAPELAGNAARLRGLNGARPILEGANDRSSATGRVAFSEKMRLLPVDREIARAEREAAVATAQRVASEAELFKIGKRTNEIQRERLELGKKLVRDGAGANRQDILNRLLAGEAELQGLTGASRTAAGSVSEARDREAAARRTAGELGVRRLGVEAEILEGRADRAEGGALRLGGMNQFSRANAVYALERLQQFGPDLVSPTELAAAQGIAPQTVAAILSRRGQGTEEFRRLRQIAPADFAGDPDDLRRRAGELRDAGARKGLDLERDFARAVDASGRDFGKFMADTVKTLVDSAKREVIQQLLIGKNAPG